MGYCGSDNRHNAIAREGQSGQILATDVLSSRTGETEHANDSATVMGWNGVKGRIRKRQILYGLTPDIEKNILLFKNYVSFLRTTYRDNYVLIAGLLTAFQSTGSDSITDISELQDFFMQRLRNDESFQLRGRSVPAYRQFIYICRETLTVPSYVLAASLAMERNIEATRSPVESQGAELEEAL